MASPAIKSSSVRSLRSPTDPIGLFDSGIGGLSVKNALKRYLPNEDILYYADRAHFPYGEKNPSELLQYSQGAADFLVERGIKLLAIACHTASAYALSKLKAQLPIPVLGMMDTTMSMLIGPMRVGLLGSKALIRSNVYQERIRNEKPEVEAVPIEAQELIAIVEGKRIDSPEASIIAEELLKGQRLDALLLVCTHFTFVKPLLQQVVGPDVLILDPAERMARAISDELRRIEMINPNSYAGTEQFYASSAYD